MFRIFEIRKDSLRQEIIPTDGFYTVHELGLYQIEYHSDSINDRNIFIEDECVDDKYFKEVTNINILTHPFRFFEDYFGFAQVTINKESVNLNILGEKFQLREIEEIILFLFEKNHLLLSKFVSKSSLSASNVYDGKEYFYSSKYVNLISGFIDTLGHLIPQFQKLQHSTVRKKFVVSDFDSSAIDSNSIEWLFENMNEITFDSQFQLHPNAIEINKQFGLLNRIGSESNSISWKCYEHEVILGAFQYAKSKLNELRAGIEARLRIEHRYVQNSIYTDFRDLKQIPFIRLLKSISELQKKTLDVFDKYSNVFIDAKPKNQNPKLTPVFYNYRHYRKAFETVKLLRNAKYDLSGEIQLLNIKRLSDLYELYNLHIIIELTDSLLLPQGYTREMEFNHEDSTVSKVKYKSVDRSNVIIISYQPLIQETPRDVSLITIGNTKLQGKNCRPDFVVETNNSNESRFMILDAKYSKYDTVKNLHLTSCIKKYLLDIGIDGKKYQKPDYLILLHPDSNDNELPNMYNIDYFPQVKTIISKRGCDLKLKTVIESFIKGN